MPWPVTYTPPFLVNLHTHTHAHKHVHAHLHHTNAHVHKQTRTSTHEHPPEVLSVTPGLLPGSLPLPLPWPGLICSLVSATPPMGPTCPHTREFVLYVCNCV